MRHLHVLGSLNLDYTVGVDRRPAPGETVLGKQLTVAPGGKGANQAVAAAQAGAQVTMLGCVGADADGEVLISRLEQHGIDCRGVLRDERNPTGVAMISITGDGESSIIVAPGANHAIEPEELTHMLNFIPSNGTVLLQAELQTTTLVSALEILAERAARVILNCAPAPILPDRVFGSLALLVANRVEAAQLLGVDENELQPREAVVALRDLGPHSVVITLGAQGAVAIDDHGPIELPALPVPVVDATGAGDALVGTLVARLTQEVVLSAALADGIAAAADVIQRPGAQTPLLAR